MVGKHSRDFVWPPVPKLMLSLGLTPTLPSSWEARHGNFPASQGSAAVIQRHIETKTVHLPLLDSFIVNFFSAPSNNTCLLWAQPPPLNSIPSHFALLAWMLGYKYCQSVKDNTNNNNINNHIYNNTKKKNTVKNTNKNNKK